MPVKLVEYRSGVCDCVLADNAEDAALYVFNYMRERDWKYTPERKG